VGCRAGGGQSGGRREGLRRLDRDDVGGTGARRRARSHAVSVRNGQGVRARACAAAWPPLIATAKPRAGGGPGSGRPGAPTGGSDVQPSPGLHVRQGPRRARPTVRGWPSCGMRCRPAAQGSRSAARSRRVTRRTARLRPRRWRVRARGV